MDVQRVLDEFSRRTATDPVIRSFEKRLEKGTATMTESSSYSQRLSAILGDTLKAAISVNDKDGERAQACRELLHQSYRSTNDVMTAVQRLADKRQNLNIEPLEADFPTDRVNKVANSLEDQTVEIDTIRRRADSAAENVSNSFRDDYIKKNAGARQKLGLKVTVRRRATGAKSCDWCLQLVGDYTFDKAGQADCWCRHDNCYCTIDYSNEKTGTKSTLSGNSKKWEDVPEFSPTVIEKDVAEGLTAAAKSGKMNYRDSGNGLLPPIEKVPSLQYFSDDKLNQSITKAAQEIMDILQARPLGTEAAKVIHYNKPYTSKPMIVGENGEMAVKIPQCKVPSVSIHNHPSGEHFSGRDIDRFVGDANQKVMCVIGNNGKWYVLEKASDFDYLKFAHDVLTFSKADDYADLILQGAEKYGFRYYES